jgi:multiple sugar transport system ATP-binding protein
MEKLEIKTTSINIVNLEKTFITFRGKVTALKRVDLKVKQGEFFVLLGPSGCGKSTMLNLIAGLEKPTNGTISFGERVVADPQNGIFLSPFDRDVAMVFQSYALYPHLTVEQNIEFPLTNLKRNKPNKTQRTKLVYQAAEKLQIENLLDRKPSELSGGQRQRVAIGRAIVRNPSIFLMDEPLSNLDAKLRMDMRAQLKALQEDLGITTLYVTHDQLEAMTLGDRIAILSKGIIQQLGSPVEVYDRPINVFVAKFIGSPTMNLFDGEIIDKNGKTIFRTEDFDINLPDKIVKLMKENPSNKYYVGIRPQHINILPKGQGNVDIKINVHENIGGEYLIYSFLKNEKQIIIESTELPNNKEISIGMEPKNIHLFDGDENRIN